MREKLLITKSDQLPIFLQKYVPKCSRFVRTIDNKFVNASKEKLQQFTNHLILSFYFEHGDVERVDEDLDSLLNENKIKNKGSTGVVFDSGGL